MVLVIISKKMILVLSGYCKLCCKTFKIDGSGSSQVKKHESSILHTSRNKANQRTFINDKGTVSISKN